MAEAAVTFLLENLTKMLSKEMELLTGVKNEVRSLQGELLVLQPCIRSVKAKCEEKPVLTEFIKRVRAAARDAEDMIDEYASLVAAQYRGANFWVRTISKFSQPIERHRVAKEIKHVTMRLEEIYKFQERFCAQDPQLEYLSIKRDMPMQSKTLLLEETNLVGSEAHTMTIIEQLIDGGAQRDVISIIGVGGIGKTTLARRVYSDPAVIGHFNFRTWVYVFPEYEVRDVLVAILKRAMGLTTEDLIAMSDEELALEVRKYLRSTAYLIVLDDLSGTQLWEQLNKVIPKNMYGSRIILTSRNSEVDKRATPSPLVHHMELLSKEDSWKLFSRRVFGGGTCPSELTVLAEELVDKCGGLPLAIVVLAGALLKKVHTYEWWSEVSSSLSSYLALGTNQWSDILELSYTNLPHHLRPCFLYLSLFPEHMEISARRLVRLWAAEGFVHENNGRTMEEVGNDYLEELVARNLVQVSKRRVDRSIKSCLVHDLLQDLCILKAKEEKCVELLGNRSSLPFNPRRVSFRSNMLSYIFSNTSNSHIRSMLCFNVEDCRLSVKDWKLIEKHVPLIRVLDLWDADIELIPKEVDCLIHLRYLRLRSLTAQSLPASIGNLWKLQTLDVTAPCIHRPLIDIWKMQELRHLYFRGQAVIPEPPENMVEKSGVNVLTLSGISPDSCNKSTVTSLPNLLKLGINGDLAMFMNLAFEHLSALVKLRTLKLERDRCCKELKSLPDAIKFPPNITNLTLSETQILDDPMDILGQLPNLQLLKLKNAAYAGHELVCGSNRFPKLQVLKLVNLALRSWTVSEEASMASLKSVVIRRCGKLGGLPSALQSITDFQELELWHPDVSVVKDARDFETYKGKDRFKLVIYGDLQILNLKNKTNCPLKKLEQP